MIVISKKDIHLSELPSTFEGFTYNFPRKKMHYPDLLIFVEGHSYNVRLNTGSYYVKTECGLLFFYAKSGPGVPSCFRIFSQ